MPVEHHHTIKAGSIAQRLLFFAGDESEPAAGRRGLRHDTEGATAAYVREGEGQAHRVALVAGRRGEWVAGGLTEIDPELLPGVYELAAPDELVREGATRALLQLRFPGAVVRPIEISLVAYDPQDSERMGVWGLANHKRHEFLRRALPRFTEMELALGEDAERRLKEQLSQAPEG